MSRKRDPLAHPRPAGERTGRNVGRNVPLPREWWGAIEATRREGDTAIAALRRLILHALHRAGADVASLPPPPPPGNPKIGEMNASD